MINYINNLRYDEKKEVLFSIWRKGDFFCNEIFASKKSATGRLKHGKSEHRILLKYVDFDNMTLNQIKDI